VAATRLHLGLIRQLNRYLQAGQGYFLPGAEEAFSTQDEEAEAANEQWD
jgi:hypothetical protein